MMIILISCLFSFNNAREREEGDGERERGKIILSITLLGFVLCFLNSKDHPK
jgi:hypothetical protein